MLQSEEASACALGGARSFQIKKTRERDLSFNAADVPRNTCKSEDTKLASSGGVVAIST